MGKSKQRGARRGRWLCACNAAESTPRARAPRGGGPFARHTRSPIDANASSRPVGSQVPQGAHGRPRRPGPLQRSDVYFLPLCAAGRGAGEVAPGPFPAPVAAAVRLQPVQPRRGATSSQADSSEPRTPQTQEQILHLIIAKRLRRYGLRLQKM